MPLMADGRSFVCLRSSCKPPGAASWWLMMRCCILDSCLDGMCSCPVTMAWHGLNRLDASFCLVSWMIVCRQTQLKRWLCDSDKYRASVVWQRCVQNILNLWPCHYLFSSSRVHQSKEALVPRLITLASSIGDFALLPMALTQRNSRNDQLLWAL